MQITLHFENPHILIMTCVLVGIVIGALWHLWKGPK